MPRKLRIYGASKLHYRHIWQSVQRVRHDDFELVSRWIDWKDDPKRSHILFGTIIPEDLARADAIVAYLPNPDEHLKGAQQEIGVALFGPTRKPVVVVSPLPLVMYRPTLGDVVSSGLILSSGTIDGAITLLKNKLQSSLR